MCGRYTLTTPSQAIVDLFALDPGPNLAPRYNIAPTQAVFAVRLDPSGGREAAQLRWGLVPSWAKDPQIGNRMINARAETVREKPSFRSAFKGRRCLIAADGFYEWQKQKPGTKGGKQPYWITLADRGPFAFAGLWEHWTDGQGSKLETCTIVTCPANDLVAPIHPRMPVILGPQDHAQWLDPETAPDAAASLLRPYPA
ncbi:MAG: SOS response-associated peptidase, partial [Alphaproteobacteria bacterium]|nr:SOS response-associated peptidase [Alphaproteobacteria bacterium]